MTTTDTFPPPTFDANGYPSEESLAALRNWKGHPMDWLDYAVSLWSDYGSVASNVTVDGVFGLEPALRFATGGWSGNEDVIESMQQNQLMWLVCWYSSRRGGEVVLLRKSKGTP